MEVLSAQHPVHSSTSLSATRHSPLSGQRSSQASSNNSGYSYTLQSSSSNVSQLTSATDVSSIAGNPSRPHIQTDVQRRARTPEHSTQTSPITPVVANGTKRTASGHVKNALSYSSTASGRTRAESMSSTGSRVGELAASLKMRLGYAMTKVQHGWEHRSLGELERLTAPRPISNGYTVSRSTDDRPWTAVGHDMNFNAETNMSPPSKRRSGMFGTSAVDAYALQPAGRQLQPAAKIHSHQHNRSTDLRSLPLTGMPANAMSPPQTPIGQFPRRPPTIRTDTQTAEAERDALQALTQLGSPHTSQYSRHQNISQANSSQASPLRSEFAPARSVSFARGESDSSAIETSSEDGRLHGRR